MKEKQKIIIIGAGLCGSLLAVRLAQKGFQVDVFERRSDMRLVSTLAGRSINLALSDRGWKALRLVGIEDQIRKLCIPMNGRMIHPIDGKPFLAPYSGRPSDYINSVSRQGLNIALVEKADEMENIRFHFDAKCLKIDLEQAKAEILNTKTGKTFTSSGDVIFGTDGFGSAVRKSIQRQSSRIRFNFSQQFLEHGYKELEIPAGENGRFRIKKNALHIWPRGKYMLIALPNLDASFTVTLFLPFESENGFNYLNTKERVLRFFENKFPDVVPHMPDLVNDFFSNPVGSLGTIKCHPWQAYDNVLLLGDAAHAIVPFYGQGMNASFEDVVILDDVMTTYDGSWSKIIGEFQKSRKPDADAIADLAIDNFLEMRDHVANPVFKLKHELELLLEKKYPDFSSKYSMVTFDENISYAAAKNQGRKQDEILMEICSKIDSLGELDLEKVRGSLEG